MPENRITNEMEKSINSFIQALIPALIEAGLIKENHYGIVMMVDPLPGVGNDTSQSLRFGVPRQGHPKSVEWYLDNARGKIRASEVTRRDSHEAVSTWQGMLVGVSGIFPHPGAIIDDNYRLLVGTSGGEADEDVLISRTVRNFTVMLLDRAGQAMLDQAKARSRETGGEDRLTRAS